jgi:hypothetical protein
LGKRRSFQFGGHLFFVLFVLFVVVFFRFFDLVFFVFKNTAVWTSKG